MKTSVSHPLQIATIVSGVSGFGRVGLTFCPGKYDPYGMSGAWDRDLSLDLDAIRGVVMQHLPKLAGTDDAWAMTSIEGPWQTLVSAPREDPDARL